MFKILGADGKEYGPVTLDQLKQWITEGRANQDTQAQREGETEWKPLSQIAELAGLFSAPGTIGLAAPAAPVAPAVGTDMGGRARAEQMVSAPAICLIITAALGMLSSLMNALANIFGIGMGMGMGEMRNNNDLPPEMARFLTMFSGGMGVLVTIVAILIGAFIIYAALQMKKLRNHGLATAASVIVMIPCVSPCCLLGLPIGIWSLVVLLKPEVKSYFQ